MTPATIAKAGVVSKVFVCLCVNELKSGCSQTILVFRTKRHGNNPTQDP